MTNISEWSTTAASNNSASPDGFPEGMAPSGVNNSAREVMAAVRAYYEDAEWRDLGHTVAYATTTTFTIATDLTTTYHAGRFIRCADASTLYGHIVSSSYGAPNTTVTVKLITGNLSAGLTAVALGPDRTNPSEMIGVPVGAIMPWVPGYFGDGSNGSYTNVLPSANTAAAGNTYLNPLGYYVCNGAALNDSGSPIFNGASRYLPNLTDDRFLMGATTAGGTGGSSTMAHTHGYAHTHEGGSQTLTTAQVPALNLQLNVSNNAAGTGTNAARGTGVNDATVNVTNHSPSGSSHSHGTTVSQSASTTDGASNTENRPLYLSCFYIMRVK